MTPQLQHNITLLQIYQYLRLALSILLLTLFLTDVAPTILGSLSPMLFAWTSLAYVAVSAITIVIFPARRLQHSFNRLVGSLIIDVWAVLLLLHASGGVDSGLGYLLLVFVAIGSIFIRGQLGIAFAAMTSLLVMGESIYIAQTDGLSYRALFSAGVLGILLFITAFVFQFLTEAIRISTLEAATQAEYAAHLQRLAQAIVTRMRTGIIVIGRNNTIELINESALQLLGLPATQDYQGRALDVFPDLAPVVAAYHASEEPLSPTVLKLNAGREIKVSVAAFDLAKNQQTVIYIEDYRVLAQQAQQLKLASLGRLTASIAHEVRNPLGAISHAAQLLSESPAIAATDVRLTQIIHHHSKRVNQIIDNTLSLSRRKEAKPQQLELEKWLPRFINDYQMGKQATIELVINPTELRIKMDPTHLVQVLTNLCDNGIRYSYATTGRHHVQLVAGMSEHDETAFIEVIDDGPGIDIDKVDTIFEPFYTTEEQGSGLGLYISRELCEINQATLRYQKTAAGKSCFRIDFSHHQRTM